MSLATPLGLLGLLAIPAVLALHYFRRRYRERRVAATFLFAPDQLRAAAGRNRSKLLRSASLLCELVAALLFAMWLSGLSFGATASMRHVVLVIDDSASMAAQDADAVSAADRVRKAVSALLADLPNDATCTIVRSGARPEILVGPRALARTVGGTLEEWRPWRPRHDLGVALDLGAELAGKWGELHFYTDRLESEFVPEHCAVHALGVPRANAAILAARRVWDGATEQLHVDVVGYADAGWSTSLGISLRGPGGDTAVAEQTLALEPDAPRAITVELPAAARALPVRITLAKDGLGLDDAFELQPQPSRTVLVASVLDEAIGRALLIDHVLAALPGVRRVETVAEAHLVIGADPTGRRHELRIEAVGAADVRDAYVRPFMIERRDALCEGLTLDGVQWSAGRGEMTGLPIAHAGDQPLITRSEPGRARLRVWLNLDPSNSNFQSSPDWPVLLTNAVEHVRAYFPGASAPNVLVGEVMEWRRDARAEDADPDALRLEDPFGISRPGRGFDVIGWRARHPGVHRLLDGDAEIARFAVNFSDARESDLRRLETVERAPAPRAQSLDAGAELGPLDAGRVEGRWIALLLLVVVGLDWWVLRRQAGMGVAAAGVGGAAQ